MQTIFFLAFVAIGAAIIYFANLRQVERHRKAQADIEEEKWYKNQLFHIIIRSINESDDGEYMRAAEEQRKLIAVGNEDVKVFTCVFRDEVGYHDETWIEYEARLSAFIQQKEAERHAEIRRIDPDYYRKWVLNKRLPLVGKEGCES